MNLSRSLLFSQLCTAASSASLRNIRGGDRHSRRLSRDFSRDHRIIGGDEAPEGRYSYAVSLQDKGGQFCGGSLIAPDVVLSAAHCGGDKYFVVIGQHNLEDDDGDKVKVETELMHPDYDYDTDDNDFMLLFLKRSTRHDVDLVRVGKDFVPAGVDVTVMGWGDMAEDDDVEDHPDELMEVEVRTISNKECDRSKGWIDDDEPDDYKGDITDNMLCAEDDGEDSCQGDSGGPLVVRSDSGEDVQVGVVSWGIGCAHKDFPGVYARISAQYDWIRRNVCDGSSDPPAWFECEGTDAAVQAQEIADEQGADAAVEAQDLTGDHDLTGDQAIAAEATQDFQEWTTIVEEDFTYGFGLFNRDGNDADHFASIVGRTGVVRIAGGEGGTSAMESNLVSLEYDPFSRIVVSFSVASPEMENVDQLCLDYELDDRAVAGTKCWNSLLNDFKSGVWYDDMRFEFAASGATNLRIRIRVVGDDSKDIADDVIVDTVTISGKI